MYCYILFLSATLGTLPPPHLLTSIPLSAGGQTSTPTTTLTQPQSSPTAPVTQTTTTLPLPTLSAGLILSPAAEPFPRRLVEKAKSGQFLETKELLAGNISLLNQLDSIPGFQSLQMLGTARPRLCEVTSLSSWCYCFLRYMAILTSDPTTRDQLAYAHLIIREALRHGGMGWMDYDRAFCQQAAADPSLRWNTLLPRLQASTMLGIPPGQGAVFCSLCREVDHTRSQCALQCLHPPTARPSTPLAPAIRCKTSNVCISWNRGLCIFPGTCINRLLCATCYLPHKAKDRPKTPDSSIYRWPLPQAASTNPSTSRL